MSFNVEKDLNFKLIEEKPKTKVFEVWNTQQECMIGIVKWYPAWRHYTFFPEANTIFSDRCMMRIGRFVSYLNEIHKKKFEVKK